MQLAVLDTNGYAICPDCGTRVKCGSAGLAHLEKRHSARVNDVIFPYLDMCLIT
jgi:hypothetical protein